MCAWPPRFLWPTAQTHVHDHRAAPDVRGSAQAVFRGTFVPDEARDELEATMRRNMDFIRTLPGFRGHLVFEKREGSSTFNLVTIAVWESRTALERAGQEVRAYYARIDFDMPRTLERWRVR